MKIDKQNVFKIAVILLFLGFVAWQLYKSNSDVQQLNKNGVYVIGQRYKFKSGGSRSGTSYYFYFYNNIKYSQFGVTDGYRYDDLKFFLILPSNPKVCRIVEGEVPACLAVKDVPKGGWKELPLNLCK
jgi:hypothetical protein